MQVSAKHKVAKYACENREVQVGRDSFTGLYYVSIDGYGCSKYYRTARDAVYGMLSEHACYDIHVT